MGRFKAIKGIEHLKGVRLIDQQPIGRTPRSNPVTYLKCFDAIRQLFASERDALRQGFTPGHFSFNAAGGRCERCEGSGVEKLEMYFFEDIYAPCEICEGKRFKPEVLAIRYRGKTISDVLAITVDEALSFFTGTSKLQERLHLLSSIGLGYLRLGQSATTLSGGEAQRLKIAAELKDGTAKGMLYIMDEPTTGLHFEDVKKLLVVLSKLVNAGNTLVVVEHNLDVIKSADHVIDLGPEGGAAGGARDPEALYKAFRGRLPTPGSDLQDQRHGPIVDQLDRHSGAEDARGDGGGRARAADRRAADGGRARHRREDHRRARR